MKNEEVNMPEIECAVSEIEPGKRGAELAKSEGRTRKIISKIIRKFDALFLPSAGADKIAVFSLKTVILLCSRPS